MTSERFYAEVIGDPIEHSRSPLIHQFWLDALGIAADYRRRRVRADELESYVASADEVAAIIGGNAERIEPELMDQRRAAVFDRIADDFLSLIHI